VATGETVITGAESIETSFPEFPQALRRLGGAVEVG
jgi:5-enolpyruvylshikimate-3-phosphate synthase